MWKSSLNEFMSNVNDFLLASASVNNFGSICSQLATTLASNIPLMALEN